MIMSQKLLKQIDHMQKAMLNKGKAQSSVSASAPTAAGIAKMAPSTECITDGHYIL